MLSDSPNLLPFRRPQVSDFSTLQRLMAPFQNESMSCETNPIILLLWNALYHQKIAIEEDMLFISLGETEPLFFLPIAADMEKAIARLRDHTKKVGIRLRFLSAEGDRLQRFLARFGKEFTQTENRNDFEYIYRSDALVTLTGKKFHSKRNHISAFSRRYAWEYEALSVENIVDFIDVSNRWLTSYEQENGPSEGLRVENKAIQTLLPHFDSLGIRGGLIRLNGQGIAFTFGSPVNDRVFDIHIEKALPEYRTAYTVINRAFAEQISTDFSLINREEDMGLEGLRRAKLSYHPEFLLKKYLLEENKPE